MSRWKEVVRPEWQAPKELLKQGAWIGVQTSIAASLLFWGGLMTVDVLLNGIRSIDGYSADPYAVAVLATVGTIAATLIPGAIAGAANAYVLYHLESREKLTRITSIVSGMLVGFLVGLVLGLYLIRGYAFAKLLPSAFLIASVAAIAGGWHGWRVSRRLRKFL